MANWPIDDIEDLRLATGEMAAELLLQDEASQLQLALSVDDGRVSVTMSNDASGVRWPPEGVTTSIGYLVLKRLAERVAFDVLDGRPSIHITKQVAGG